jgi:ABC-type spermidine/putrescine transport system, permease component II
MSPRSYYFAVGRKKFIEFIFLAVFFLFFFGPLMNLIMLAFSDSYFYPDFFPSVLSLRWWNYVLTQDDILTAMGLSFTIALTTTFFTALICVPAAYALARLRFPCKNLFLFSFLLTNAFPKTGMYIAICILFYKLNLMNTFIGVVIIHSMNTLLFMTWIPAGAFKNIHKEQEEAARDAGASSFGTFMNITLPIALPGIFVALIFTFLSSLQEVDGTLLVGTPSFKTLPVVMYSIVNSYPATAGAVFSIILLIPIILILLVVGRLIGGKVLSDSLKVK